MRKDIDATNLGFLLGKIKGLFKPANRVTVLGEATAGTTRINLPYGYTEYFVLYIPSWWAVGGSDTIYIPYSKAVQTGDSYRLNLKVTNGIDNLRIYICNFNGKSIYVDFAQSSSGRVEGDYWYISITLNRVYNEYVPHGYSTTTVW